MRVGYTRPVNSWVTVCGYVGGTVLPVGGTVLRRSSGGTVLRPHRLWLRGWHRSSTPAIALGDGGYVDNEGIMTAIEWIDFLASKNTAEAKVFDRILLIRIQPAVVDLSAPEASRVVSSLRWLTGPLEALANMRSTSQVERGELEVDVGTQYIESPWWKKSEDVTSTASNEAPAIEPDETDVPNTKTVSKEFQKLNKALQRGARIESIKQSSKQTKPDQQGTISKPGTGDAIPQAFAGDRIDSLVDYPVVEVQMPFLIKDVELPLNWKLSEKQKLVYPIAWQELLKGITSQGGQHYSFFAELDAIFGLPKK